MQEKDRKQERENHKQKEGRKRGGARDTTREKADNLASVEALQVVIRLKAIRRARVKTSEEVNHKPDKEE